MVDRMISRLTPESRIIQQYPGLTWWEWALLTIIPIGILFGIVGAGLVWMPTWTYVVALGFGGAAMLPMSLVYAMSGYSIKVGFFNELIYGCKLKPSSLPVKCLTDDSEDMIEAKGSSRHPLGQLAYRIISGNVWYDARTVLEDQKVSFRRGYHRCIVY